MVLDPRYKLGSVRGRYKQLNDEVKAAIVKVHLENMFREYSVKMAAYVDQVKREECSSMRQRSDDDIYGVRFI